MKSMVSSRVSNRRLNFYKTPLCAIQACFCLLAAIAGNSSNWKSCCVSLGWILSACNWKLAFRRMPRNLAYLHIIFPTDAEKAFADENFRKRDVIKDKLVVSKRKHILWKISSVYPEIKSCRPQRPTYDSHPVSLYWYGGRFPTEVGLRNQERGCWC